MAQTMMCSRQQQQQQQQEQQHLPMETEQDDGVVNVASPTATNQAVLDHFGNSRLYSYAQNTEASARKVLANKMVLLYFSASWCGPCKRFTPHLMELYEQVKGNISDDDFEIVFCSSDMLAGPYEEYASHMPWWCLPFQSSAVVERLSTVYQTTGIPHLVVLDKDGSVLHADAVEKVLSSPSTEFPWRPTRLVDLLMSCHCVTANNNDDSTHCNQDWHAKPYLLIYAGSYSCSPCQRLTPKIAQVYQQLKAQRDDFEFVYLSSDRNQSDFDACLQTLGCCAIPYEERQVSTAIAALLQIQCLPNLLLLGPPGENGDRPVMNRHVRDLFWQNDNNDDAATLVAEFPFCPRTFGDLNLVSDNIHETKCLVVLCEACDDEEQAEYRKVVQLASQAYECEPRIRFYWTCEVTSLTETLRTALGLGPPCCGPHVILLDFPANGSYYVCPPNTMSDITVQSLLDFVSCPGPVQRLG